VAVLKRRSVSLNLLQHPVLNDLAADPNGESLQVGTYNVNGRKPPLGLDLKPWLAAAPESDVVVAGFQEIVPLNASNVMNGEQLPGLNLLA
jgi:hypothetical protein